MWIINLYIICKNNKKNINNNSSPGIKWEFYQVLYNNTIQNINNISDCLQIYNTLFYTFFLSMHYIIKYKYLFI
jgi:hypothetical protein